MTNGQNAVVERVLGLEKSYPQFFGHFFTSGKLVLNQISFAATIYQDLRS